MKRITISSVFAVCFFQAAYTQNGSSFQNRGFVTRSAEMSESGKHFFNVNLNDFNSDSERAAFMESVYAESRIFPVSVVNEKGFWILSAHTSVITEEEAVSLILDLRGKTIGKKAGSESIQKLIEKK